MQSCRCSVCLVSCGSISTNLGSEGMGYHLEISPFAWAPGTTGDLCQVEDDELAHDEDRDRHVNAVTRTRHGHISDHRKCYWDSPQYIPSIRLLTVCRRIHEEANLIPFGSNTFIFRSEHDFPRFIRRLEPRQRNAIARIICPWSMERHLLSWRLVLGAECGRGLPPPPHLKSLTVLVELEAKNLTPEVLVEPDMSKRPESKHVPIGALLALRGSPLVDVKIVVRHIGGLGSPREWERGRTWFRNRYL